MKNRFALLLVFCTILLGACGESSNTISSETAQSAVETANNPPPHIENSPAQSFDLPETTDGQEPRTTSEDTPSPESIPPATNSDPVPPAISEAVPNEPITKEEILHRYVAAMSELQPEVQFNISGITWEFGEYSAPG